MRKLLLSILALQLIGCATMKTGSDFSKISPGMTQAQVLEIMGNPDSFTEVNGYLVWEWKYRKTRDLTFWEGMEAGDVRRAGLVESRVGTADYYVIYQNGAVRQKGTGNPQQSPVLNVNVNAELR